MGNIDFFKKELAKSFQYYIGKEVLPRIGNFILDKKINKKIKKTNDNTVKPQYVNRKSKNTDSVKRAR